jgi:uncharacterized protein YceH (UPF0502 family)
MQNEPGTAGQASAPSWRPLAAVDRRVLGVLAEKAKTTPDAYPMTLNALVAGCNQKSNRSPVMQLDESEVQSSLDRLRELGAVSLVVGGGRVEKYRHYLYEWLGVDKLELAVMTELLLRGAQTEGELRGRASRMDPIDDLPRLRQIFDALKAKSLVVPLTPPGRGHVVAHALYEPREMSRLRSDASAGAGESAAAAPLVASQPQADGGARLGPRGPEAASEGELRAIRERVSHMQEQLDALGAQVAANRQAIDRLLRALGE